MDIGSLESITNLNSPSEPEFPFKFRSNQWRRLRIYAGTAIGDCMIIIGSCIISNFIGHKSAYPEEGIVIATVIMPLYLFICLLRQNYSLQLLTHWRESASASISALMISALFLLFIAFYLHAFHLLSRVIFTSSVIVSSLMLVLSRLVVDRLAKSAFGGYPMSGLLISDGMQYYDLPGFLVIDAGAMKLKPDMSDPHMLDKLGRLLRGADRVVVACKVSDRLNWALALKGANVRAEILVPEIDSLRPLGAGHLGQETTLLVAVGPLSIGNRVLKRVLDLLIATALIAFLAPLMLLTACLIAAESKGPVFFKQSRVGRGNRLFLIYKFRSMTADNCDLTASKLTVAGDRRVTRIGRIIRATSIDELPQIFNVIRGEMSLVGPRPHALGALAGDQLYWEVDERYWNRHSTKPGMTGLAQVLGFRGNTYERQDLVNRLQADLDYIHGWTIWRDLRILVATIRVVVHKNAY